MHILDLTIHIFMALSFTAGITMLVLTVEYRKKLRRVEQIGRYILATLLIYSVFMRYLIMLPEQFKYLKEMSIGFDVLYISLCIAYNKNILSRRGNDRK